jgi:uncharacterized phiE125 gp8 family phage protein
MGYKQTLAPTVEPVSLDDARAHCRVYSTDEDGYLSGLLVKARRYVERVLDRQLITATWQLDLEGFPDEIELRKLPVSSIDKIEYADPDTGVMTELAVTQYQYATLTPDEPARIAPAYGLCWPSVRGDVYSSVRITFKAGYGAAATSVPDDYQHAVLLLVGHWFLNRESVADQVLTPVPEAFQALLAECDWGNYG